MRDNFKVIKGLITQKLDDKTVIFDGEKSIIYTLNETASFIFKKIKSKMNKKEIINAMVKKYKVSDKRATKDLSDLIKSLTREKIIKPIV
jgi:DNA-directed RNA polymerase delta subunit